MKRFFAILLCSLSYTTYPSDNLLSTEQRTVIRGIIQEEMSQHTLTREIKQVARKYADTGACYTACTLGFGYGLYHLGSAQNYMINYANPRGEKNEAIETDKRRNLWKGLRSTMIGLTFCGISGYGLYRLLYC